MEMSKNDVDYTYSDKYGTTWIYHSDTELFEGSRLSGDSVVETWQYDLVGNTVYTNNALNMKWVSQPDESEVFTDLSSMANVTTQFNKLQSDTICPDEVYLT
jgi:hypothetical protein